MKIKFAAILHLVFSVFFVAECLGFEPGGPNLALGCAYEFSPAPNYPHCLDPDDASQLTDGIYTKDYFWVQQSTVGWQAGRAEITLDLGREENICGASLNTAGGIAGVTFPSSICMLASLDKTNWAFIGELTQLGTKEGKPTADKYNIFRYATNELAAHGRYVKFIILNRPYIFADEIEVYGGGDGGELVFNITDTDEALRICASVAGANVRLQRDFDSMKQALIDNGVFDEAAEAEFSRIGTELQENGFKSDSYFRAILPYGELHKEILAQNSAILARQGYTKPFLWKNNRWENLGITEIPPSPLAGELVVEMMRNEVRGETLNICNPLPEMKQAVVTVEGLPESANLILNQVLFTDTNEWIVIADALLPAKEGNRIPLPLYAGCNAQIWFSFKRPSCQPGTYAGKITLSIDGEDIAEAGLQLVVYDLDFPKEPTVHVGGWDYTNTRGHYFSSPGSLDKAIALMRDTYVDSPWATNAVMPTGDEYDEEGHLTNPQNLNFQAWDEWTALWKGARRYCVFWSIGDTFRSVPPSDPRFNVMLTEYINAWMAYVKSTGFNPKDVVVLLFDEPYNEEHANRVVEWSRPIKANCPDFTLFQDPNFTDPRPINPEFFKVNDIICLNTPLMHEVWTFEKPDPNFADNFRDFYVEKREEGTELWLYSCRGPSRTLDPVTYHRGQFWRAIDIKATASMYWAWGCGGGIGDSWQPYSQTSVEYSPYFVGKTTSTNAKHNEAVREGVQDYEYFIMLDRKIAGLQAEGKEQEAQEAQAVYDKALADGLSTLSQAKKNKLEWEACNEHALMDEARIAILRALVK